MLKMRKLLEFFRGNMKIKYDLTNNYLKYYNEGTGAYLIRKKLLKNKDKKIRRYSTYNLIYLIINMILAIISLAIYTIYSLNIFYHLSQLFNFLATFFFMCICMLFTIPKLKFGSKKGVIILDENGVQDKEYDSKTVIFAWDKLKLVTITKNTITFIFDDPIIFISKNEKKEKIIKEIKKYSKAKIIIQDQ